MAVAAGATACFLLEKRIKGSIMKYANSFKVNPQEMEVIENALNRTLSLCLNELHTLPQGAKAETLRSNIREVNELLGSLHNQKNWYRPKSPVYISG